MTRRARPRRDESGAVDKVAATHQRLLAAVDDLVAADAWRALLRVSARVRPYSANNQILIAAQRPGATIVHGYKDWERRGRQVRKGERGIAILAPVLTPNRDPDSPDRPAPPRRDEQPAPKRDPDSPDRVVRGFRVAYVFDFTQTDGPPLTEVPTPQLLDGAAPLGLFSDLVDVIEAAGFRFGYANLEKGNGRTDFTTREVLILPDLSAAQTVKTLAHEAAHVVLHDPASNPHLDLRPIEVEAESVAYIVTAAHGLPSDVYSVPYVTGWAGGNRDLLTATATRVLDAARGILAVADPDCPDGWTERRSRTLDRSRDVASDRAVEVARGAAVVDLETHRDGPDARRSVAR